MGHHSHRTVTTLQGVTRLTRHLSIGAAIKHARAPCAGYLDYLFENWRAFLSKYVR
jgi:hypothetical protein